MIFVRAINLGIENIPIEDSTLTESQETDYDEVLKHQKKYTNLLSIYINTTRMNLYSKIIFKFAFFLITMVIWLYLIKLFKLSFDAVLTIINIPDTPSNYIKTTIDLLAAIVPSLVSLITSFIVIPKIIAKYLFNVKEENSMVEIIKSLQSYDDDLYKHRYNEELLAHQEYLKSHSDLSEEEQPEDAEALTDNNRDTQNEA